MQTTLIHLTLVGVRSIAASALSLSISLCVCWVHDWSHQSTVWYASGDRIDFRCSLPQMDGAEHTHTGGGRADDSTRTGPEKLLLCSENDAWSFVVVRRCTQYMLSRATCCPLLHALLRGLMCTHAFRRASRIMPSTDVGPQKSCLSITMPSILIYYQRPPQNGLWPTWRVDRSWLLLLYGQPRFGPPEAYVRCVHNGHIITLVKLDWGNSKCTHIRSLRWYLNGSICIARVIHFECVLAKRARRPARDESAIVTASHTHTAHPLEFSGFLVDAFDYKYMINVARTLNGHTKIVPQLYGQKQR